MSEVAAIREKRNRVDSENLEILKDKIISSLKEVDENSDSIIFLSCAGGSHTFHAGGYPDMILATLSSSIQLYAQELGFTLEDTIETISKCISESWRDNVRCH